MFWQGFPIKDNQVIKYFGFDLPLHFIANDFFQLITFHNYFCALGKE